MGTKKYLVDNQSEFDKAIDSRANKILEDYKKLNLKKHETTLKNKFQTDLRIRYVELETSKFFIEIFNAIKKIDFDFDKGQTDFDAIKIFIETSKRNSKDVLECLIEYYGTVEAMTNKIPNYDIQYNQEQIQTLPLKEQLPLPFVLNDKVISKIDFIRLINSMWEIKVFKNKDGLYPSKQSVMKEFGNYVGIDLRNYEILLSKAVNTTDIETNVKIFDTLKDAMTDYYNKILEKKGNK